MRRPLACPLAFRCPCRQFRLPSCTIKLISMAQFETFCRPPATQDTRGPKLKSRVCVVTGGSGTVGSGIVRQLLLEGATVIAPLRRNEQIEELHRECKGVPLDHLMPVVVNVSHDPWCAEFVDGVLQRYGRIDHAVSCFGAWWEGGPLTEQPTEELYRVLADCATTHFTFAKHVLPAMKMDPSSSFLFVTGGAGERCLSSESSLYTVASSMLYGIILAAQSQFAEHPFRINELRLHTFFKRHGELGSQSYVNWYGKRMYSNRKVGKLAADALIAPLGRTERIAVTPERLDGISLTV